MHFLHKKKKKLNYLQLVLGVFSFNFTGMLKMTEMLLLHFLQYFSIALFSNNKLNKINL